MTSELLSAIAQIAEEKGISKEAVLETVEAALAAAYRKDFGEKNQNINNLIYPSTATRPPVISASSAVIDA